MAAGDRRGWMAKGGMLERYRKGSQAQGEKWRVMTAHPSNSANSSKHHCKLYKLVIYKFDELIIWWIVAFTELPILWSGFQCIEPSVWRQSHISPYYSNDIPLLWFPLINIPSYLAVFLNISYCPKSTSSCILQNELLSFGIQALKSVLRGIFLSPHVDQGSCFRKISSNNFPHKWIY